MSKLEQHIVEELYKTIKQYFKICKIHKSNLQSNIEMQNSESADPVMITINNGNIEILVGDADNQFWHARTIELNDPDMTSKIVQTAIKLSKTGPPAVTRTLETN